jgi:hypothetical protein
MREEDVWNINALDVFAVLEVLCIQSLSARFLVCSHD